MKHTSFCLPLFFLLSVQALEAQQRGLSTADRLRSGDFGGDSLAVRSLDPSADLFPDASLVDFSILLDPPAGKYGFVRIGKKGRLELNNDRPARFWGVVIDNRSLAAPPFLIGKTLEALARAGVNLIRLGGSRPGAAHEEATTIDERLGRIDYWVSEARKRGIYSSLNLGVVDSLDSPLGAFSKIYLQVRKLIIDSSISLHKNPFTGLSYAEDPAIAFFELGGTKSLLSEPGLWTKMPEPYWKEFNDLWNLWLEKQYRSTARLRAAWTNSSGIVALAAQESLEKKNIRLPSMDDTPFDQAILAPYHDPLRSPARRSDAVRFVMALQNSYHDEMREYASREGIRVPILAGTRNDLIPFSAATNRVFRMTTGDSYHDYPTESSRKEFVGQELFSNRNPLTERGSMSFAPSIARIHWSGSPAAVRAWTACWPNVFRSAGVLEVAAYSLFQGVDLVVHDSYSAIGDLMSIGSLGVQSDPARWGLFGLASKMFLSGDVREAETTVAIAYAEDDLATYASYENALYELSWNHRIINRFSDEEAEGADFTVTSGRSHVVGLEEENSILYARSPLVETKKQQVINERNSLYSRSGYPLKTYVLRNDSVRIGLDSSTAVYVKPRFAFRTGDVEKKGLVPVGADPSGTYTAGFVDTAKNVLGLGGIVDAQAGAIILQHVNRNPRTPFLLKDLRQGIYQSDTRELVRNIQDGVLIIKASEFASVQGAFRHLNKYDAGAFSAALASHVGTIAATSLDGKPLTQAGQILIKMVTVAENTGQRLDTATVPGVGRRYVLRSKGGFPVVTKGVSSDQPTTVWLNGRKILDVYMENGTWEVVLDLGRKEYLLYCDTPGMRFHFFPEEPERPMNMERFSTLQAPKKETATSREIRYPAGSKYVKLVEKAK